MNVLVACEFSGAVRDAFRRRGHEAWSADLENVEPEGEFPQYHLFGDARLWLDGSAGPCPQWDLLIAHPPCTFLANSGAKHLYLGMSKANGPDPARWEALREGAEFFLTFWNAPIPRRCVENPIMLKAAQSIIGCGPTQIIQPYEFGVPESKATCLWLKGLPKLRPTNPVWTYQESTHRMAPGPNRQKDRSRTFPAMAEAFAAQWG